VSGVNITLGADGIQVRTESVAALLAGGVAFDLPEFAAADSKPAPPKSEFTLYRYRGIAMKEPDPVERRYVLYFNESVRGLTIGAPVTLFGLQVGEVTDVGLTYDPKTTVFRPRVIVTFFPDRLVAALPTGQRQRSGRTMAEMSPEERIRIMRRVVEDQGLRAQLRTGSLLTGELYVAFEYFPDAPK
jgi:paraquat-inducible protein B